MNKTKPENNEHNIKVSSEEALVLFELLSRFSGSDKLSIEHPAESQALCNLCCILESKLSEPFSPDYKQLLEQAQESLTKEN